MRILPADERFLQHALTLAEDAAALASPNPTVGCVLVRDGHVLGKGAHRYDERDHAEIVALKHAARAGENVNGSTAYVTLEPCSHHGRTGPCADALIAAGIRRCVVATVDPNPQVRGQGIAKLRAAGVQVVVADPASPLAQQARRLNDAFAFSIQHGRPFVTLKAAVSSDGKLAPPPTQRSGLHPFWLTGPAARADVQRLRHASDALLTGIGTVLADNPSLTDRTGLPRRRPLLRVVLDSHLRTPLDAQLVLSANRDLLLFASSAASPAREKALHDAGAELLRWPAYGPDAPQAQLSHILAYLSAQGIRSLLVEAGSALNGSLLAGNLVDQLILYKTQKPLGPEGLPFAKNYPSPEFLEGLLNHKQAETFPHGDGEDLRISGYLHDPWTDV